MQHYVSNFLAIMGPAATRDEIPLVPLLPRKKKKFGMLFLYFILFYKVLSFQFVD